MKYETLLFDLDDTLMDFTKAEELSIEASYCRFFTKYTDMETYKRTYYKINSSLWDAVDAGDLGPAQVKILRFRQVIDILGAPHDAITVATHYEDKLGHEVHWFPEVKNTLEYLNEHHMIGIITNGITNIQRKKYKHSGLAEITDCFIISESVGVSKPAKKIFELALDQLGARVESTLMIGDSLSSDYQGALNMGLDFCWIKGEGLVFPEHLAEPRFIVQSVKEIPLIIDCAMCST